MDDFALAAARELDVKKVVRRRVFLLHVGIYLAVNIMLVAIWAMTGGGHPWFVYPILGWGVGIVAHGLVTYMKAPEDVVMERERRSSLG